MSEENKNTSEEIEKLEVVDNPSSTEINEKVSEDKETESVSEKINQELKEDVKKVEEVIEETSKESEEILIKEPLIEEEPEENKKEETDKIYEKRFQQENTERVEKVENPEVVSLETSFWDKFISTKYVLLIIFLFCMINLLITGLIVKSENSEIYERLRNQDSEITSLKVENETLKKEIAVLKKDIEDIQNTDDSSDIPSYDFNNFFEDFGKIFGGYGGEYEFGYDGSSPYFREKTEDKTDDKVSDKGYLGVKVSETKDGVIIEDILSTRDDSTFKKNDKIIEIEGKKVSTVDEISSVLANHKVGDELKVKVIRNDDETILKVKLVEEYKETVETIQPRIEGERSF